MSGEDDKERGEEEDIAGVLGGSKPATEALRDVLRDVWIKTEIMWALARTTYKEVDFERIEAIMMKYSEPDVRSPDNAQKMMEEITRVIVAGRRVPPVMGGNPKRTQEVMTIDSWKEATGSDYELFEAMRSRSLDDYKREYIMIGDNFSSFRIFLRDKYEEEKQMKEKDDRP